MTSHLEQHLIAQMLTLLHIIDWVCTSYRMSDLPHERSATVQGLFQQAKIRLYCDLLSSGGMLPAEAPVTSGLT